jgi:PAS domain S-box-containing protein
MNGSELQEQTAAQKILVVDDDKNAAAYVAELLRRERYDVAVSHSGAGGLDLVKERGFDLVLLDVMMPGMDGFTTAARMREVFGKDNFVPIILLTALAGQKEKLTGLSHADDFITKPFIAEELLARIRVMLRIRHLQRELLVSKSNYEFLYENAPYMYVTVDQKHMVTDCNEMFFKSTGLARESVAGKKFSSFFRIEDSRAIDSFLDTVTDDSVHAARQNAALVIAMGADGLLFVGLSAVRMVREGGHSIMVAMQDVTQNVRLEQEQQIARVQLYRSARLASIGTFASGVAHELNNPLTAILGFSGALLERVRNRERMDPVELEQYLSIINAETLRCRDTIENLSRFAREGEVQIRGFKLDECVGDALALVKARAMKKNVAIVKDISAAVCVSADLEKLQQAIVYVVTNSLDFCGSGSTVAITADTGPQFVGLRISDNGPGIAPEVLPKVFDPFFTTKQVGQGMGLGLAMSYVIMEECNGSIDVTSEKGKGTTVVLEIPVARQGAAQ